MFKAADIRYLEDQIAADPFNSSLRTRIVEISFPFLHDSDIQCRRSVHVHWLIANAPELPAQLILPEVDRSGYEVGRQLWNDAVVAAPSNVEVLSNASLYMSANQEDLRAAAGLMERLVRLKPSVSTFRGDFAAILELCWWDADEVDRKRLSSEMAEQYELAAGLSVDSCERLENLLGLLRSLIRMRSFTVALETSNLARSIIDLGFIPEKTASYAAHIFHIIQGSVALNASYPDFETAKEQLFYAARCCTFGAGLVMSPDFSLVSRLLELGEEDAVLKYLLEIRTRWPGERVDGWIDSIERGSKPDFFLSE